MQSIRINETRTSLCHNCRYAHTRRPVGSNTTFIICTADPHGYSRTTAPMEYCDSHSSKTELQLYEMKKLAWVVETHKKEIIGFQSPDQLVRRHGEPEELEHLEDKLPWQLR